MYYEIRTYRIKTGALPVYLKLVEEEGIALQKQYLGELVGYFYSEIGPLNQIVHIWAYPSLDEREARRTALAADPAWLAFAPKIQALLEEMESKIMKAAAFSPLQ
jgi:hypothetical protein